MADATSMIQLYFTFGMTYKDIVSTMAVKHGFVISIRHLKRVLKAWNLTRRKYSRLQSVVEFVLSQLKGKIIFPKALNWTFETKYSK